MPAADVDAELLFPARPLGPVEVAGERTEPSDRRRFEIPAARLVTGGWLSMPVEVVVGAQAGPRLWLSGAIHGDELDGIEIIRRVLDRLEPAEMAGSVIATPIVNVFAFVGESRYLPDRRDLNRSFPGSKGGSLAARIARLFMTEVVAQCDAGLDFHCGSDDRVNLPQVRADLDHEDSARLARIFAAPVVMHGRPPAGSLRAAARAVGAPVLVYEGGQAGRFTETAIRRGVDGVGRVLEAVGIGRLRPPQHHGTTGHQEPTRLEPARSEHAPRGHRIGTRAGDPEDDPIVARRSTWIRAGQSGIFRSDTRLGAQVAVGEPLGTIADAFGDGAAPVRARAAGVVVGLTAHPLVNRGDAIAHIAVPD